MSIADDLPEARGRLSSNAAQYPPGEEAEISGLKAMDEMNDREWEEFLIGAAFGDAQDDSPWSRRGAEVRARLQSRLPSSVAAPPEPGFSAEERQEVLRVIEETGDLSWTVLDEDAERVRISPMVPKDAMRWAEYFGLRMFVSAEAAREYLDDLYDAKQVAWARRRYFEWLIPAAIAEAAAGFNQELNQLPRMAADDGFEDDIPF